MWWKEKPLHFLPCILISYILALRVCYIISHAKLWSLDFILFSFFFLSSMIKSEGMTILARSPCLFLACLCLKTFRPFFLFLMLMCLPDPPWCWAQKSSISLLLPVQLHWNGLSCEVLCSDSHMAYVSTKNNCMFVFGILKYMDL